MRLHRGTPPETIGHVPPGGKRELTLRVVGVGEDALGPYVTMRWEEQEQQADLHIGDCIELNLYNDKPA